MALKLIVL